MDVTQELADAENSLRDFIALVLSSQHGPDWLEKCGVSPERLGKWRERKKVEAKRQKSGVVEERLIYYADFYDVRTILKKNWSGPFADAFGDWRTMDVYLKELEKLRDPDAHRRELLPHQKHLIMGVAGELRTKIVRYRSKLETPEDCFPRIESVRDSLGNIWVPQGDSGVRRRVVVKQWLRPGDVIEYVITARDPEDLKLEYGIRVQAPRTEWQDDNVFRVPIQRSHIGRGFTIALFIRSPRPYHASVNHDGSVRFLYAGVLPARSGI